MANFKVNIYPVIYWGLAYALIAGFVLFVLFLLSKYITVIWFPVFLAGLVWGAYRNYKKQKDGWSTQSGESQKTQSAVEEVKDAARDIFSATKDMVAEQLDEETVEREAVVEEVSEEAPVPPEPVQVAPPETEEVEPKKPETPPQPRTPV